MGGLNPLPVRGENIRGHRALRWLAALAVTVFSTSLATAADLPAFFSKHCFECHDSDSHKGGLDLTRLNTDWNDRKVAGIWEHIHDRVASGQMPPKKHTEQPSPTARAQFVASLQQELHAASSVRQQNDGRVVLRRLNRTEYEHTLHDLLGISVPLQDLLPEDNPIAGFDTVSVGLETSATHLVRYQQAAEKALDAALHGRPLKSTVTRVTGRQYLDGRLPVHRKGIDPFVRLDGDALVLHAVLYGDNSMQAPHPPIAGRYRIRASVRTVNTGGKPMSVLIGKRVDRFATEKLKHIVDIKDVPAGQTTVIEVETDLKYSNENQFIYFEGIGLPFFSELAKQRKDAPVGDDFAGPGLAVDWAELEGPLDIEVGYRRLFGGLPQLPTRIVEDQAAGKPVNDGWTKLPPMDGQFAKWPLIPVTTDAKGDADRLIRDFLPRAFRRPVSEALAGHYAKLVHTQLDAGERFDVAMRNGYKAILCSPYFLFFVEKSGALDGHAVAARLARFLWGSLPDDELTSLAASGQLLKPEVLRAQSERLLNHPKARRFTLDFTGQWLDLRKFLDMKPDDVYVEYDDHLAWSMPRESTGFFTEVLAKDLPTSSFLHSDWTFLNERLARHYGIPGVTGLELRRVALPPTAHRGGVITHASVLKMTTNATYTSPIKRGAWLLERIIGKPPPPPPPDVKAIEPDIRGAVTIREQLDKHKDVAVCASCHRHIDPPGFALENFDVVGGWREFYRVKQPPKDGRRVELANYPGKQVWLAKPVEAGGETDQGQAFANIDEYKQLLLKDPDQLARNLVQKTITYATGAEPQFADRVTVEKIVRDLRERNAGFRSLLHAVIQSPVFLRK